MPLLARGLCLLALLSSCAGPGWTPLNGPALRASGPTAITVEAHSSSMFRTPSGGGPGSLLAMAQNSGMMKDDVEDPAQQVGDQLAMMLAKRYRLEVKGQTKSAAATAEQGRPDLTLSIQTSDWGIECHDPHTRENCYVVYRASLELKDNRSGRLLAAGDCENTAADRVIVGTRRVNVTLVVHAMEQAAEDCVDFFRTKLLGIYSK
jgi:hypothetical protein